MVSDQTFGLLKVCGNFYNRDQQTNKQKRMKMATSQTNIIETTGSSTGISRMEGTATHSEDEEGVAVMMTIMASSKMETIDNHAKPLGGRDNTSITSSSRGIELEHGECKEDHGDDDEEEDSINRRTKKRTLRLAVTLSILLLLAIVVAIAIIVPVTKKRTSRKNGGTDQANTAQLPPQNPPINSSSAHPVGGSHNLGYTDDQFLGHMTPSRDFLAISNQIKRIIPSTVLYNTSTPQYRALEWILFTDPMKLGQSDPNLVQRYVLALFYFQTTARYGSWNSSCIPPDSTESIYCTGSESRIRWLSDSSECEWDGVLCNDANQTTSLELGTYLEYLSLSLSFTLLYPF